MINRPGGNPYYYHQHGWYDMNRVYHQPGYYGQTGYHYRTASDIGYCPPRGAPDYMSRCGSSPWLNYLLFGCCCCLCGFCVAAWWYMTSPKNESAREWHGRRSSASSSSSNDMEMTPAQGDAQGDPMTRQGQTIPRPDALAFLQAAEAEYVYGSEGEVGTMYDRRHILEEVTQRLECEEDAIRNAPDRQMAVRDLASRWGMLGSLNS